jgi:predicted phage baseplate assembly protein
VPILPPALDDRAFADLVDEALARIPAHTPEWQPRLGDPGRTLVELFAWLVDTLLYRANLIPEKQRLQFLRLLGIPLRPAAAARGVVALTLDDDTPEAATLRRLCTVKGPTTFETLDEVTVLPVTAECYYKRRPDAGELRTLAPILGALPQVYDLGEKEPCYYVTTPVFVGGAALPGGLDVIRDTVDSSLWIALVARAPDQVAAARTALGSAPDGTARLLSIGFAPAIEMPEQREDVTKRLQVPHVFEITTGRDPTGADSDYLTLDHVGRDTTQGLTRRGVRRLVLPSASDIGVPTADRIDPLRAGVGDRPPRIDDAKLAQKLVAWVRLRPTERMDSLRVAWVGINAVEVENRTTQTGKIVGTSSGTADQEFKLPGDSIEPPVLDREFTFPPQPVPPARFTLQVESAEGFVTWAPAPDLALADRDDEVYQLDPEAGTVRFGDGVRGRIPPGGARIRIDLMRSGGGAAGNLPPNTLKQLAVAEDPQRQPVTRAIVVAHGLPLDGGKDAETLAQAERRIPSWLRHRDRAVTAADYRAVAAETPGVALGRVEVMPQFKPQQRRAGVPGVVSIVVWPQKPTLAAPNPRADRPLIEAVHAWLDARRPLATELYVIGCEYVPVAVSAGIVLREGAPRDEVLGGVRDAIRRFLWPLVPGGADGTGWPLGRTVKQRELEVVVAQVGGVAEVTSVNLFAQRDGAWELAPGAPAAAIALEPWQLPELLAVTANVGDPHDDPSHLPNPYAGACVGIPVVPEVC